jgi:hypothetical protein
MQRLLYGLAIATLCQPFALVQAQTPLNPVIPVSLPVKATVWLKAGGSTLGQVKGFDASKQMFTLGNQPIQVAQVSKVVFDRKALAYRSDGKLIIRGEDTAKPKQSTWSNIALSAFQVKDAKLGQAQVNLKGILPPLQVRGIQAIAKDSVYVVDEIQFQPRGKMMIKVTSSDR